MYIKFYMIISSNSPSMTYLVYKRFWWQDYNIYYRRWKYCTQRSHLLRKLLVVFFRMTWCDFYRGLCISVYFFFPECDKSIVNPIPYIYSHCNVQYHIHVYYPHTPLLWWKYDPKCCNLLLFQIRKEESIYTFIITMTNVTDKYVKRSPLGIIYNNTDTVIAPIVLIYQHVSYITS